MKRGKPLRRTASLRTRKPMNRGTTKLTVVPKYDPTSAPARKTVKKRAGEGAQCEAQIPGVCLGEGTNYHHRKNVSQGGEYAPSAALLLCGSGCTGCHGWITEHPAEACDKSKGWSVKSWADPAITPVLYRGRLVLLGDDGSVNPVDVLGVAA